MKDGFGKGLLKVLEKGTVPLPDRLFDKPAFIASGDQLHLDFGGNTLTKDHQDGTYMIHLEHPDGIALTLKMTPQKQVSVFLIIPTESEVALLYCIVLTVCLMYPSADPSR